MHGPVTELGAPSSHHEPTVRCRSTSLQQKEGRRFCVFFHHSLLLHRLCSRQEHQWPVEQRLTLPPPSGSCLPPLRDQRPVATSWASLVKAARLRSIGSFGGECQYFRMTRFGLELCGDRSGVAAPAGPPIAARGRAWTPLEAEGRRRWPGPCFATAKSSPMVSRCQCRSERSISSSSRGVRRSRAKDGPPEIFLGCHTA